MDVRYPTNGIEPVIEEVKNETIKLIDSSTMSLCLNLFDRAKFRTAKGGLKIHTVWDDTLGLSRPTGYSY